MKYTWLTEERKEWRRQLESGGVLNIYVLQQYRLNRNSDLWRSTREVEKLCETILFLEGAKPMSEKYTVNCDFCHGDISYVTEESAYRIRVMEEGRQASSVQPSKPGELERFMNFCNLAHLKEWLAQR
ncbi:hypothetical protein UFOVP260_22 [uncultured Caudovirales phage]|uniref:Uncharacterized protein n=1 Tax=uncultured Caudovirales phage TaxID=2100421 RepID=A0A6J5KXH9_9CAUD|nr:hypothetical protein UFOVP85_40 [uncultured Caudovirales phage]CAB4132447.1 hypothetical protein UFOVP260_22 [uncultured Caudovirales phage]CAB4202632.1 hypothetical protein UFOVP1363_23 [uncultured Caudovirales phage]CAB5207300.1 hypothetical protein UFOVP179_57 [uncultured Caudovirales phage]